MLFSNDICGSHAISLPGADGVHYDGTQPPPDASFVKHLPPSTDDGVCSYKPEK